MTESRNCSAVIVSRIYYLYVVFYFYNLILLLLVNTYFCRNIAEMSEIKYTCNISHVNISPYEHTHYNK